MKQKTNREGDAKKVNNYDSCQTPSYALDPIMPYLSSEWVIWESAAGEGILSSRISQTHEVITTDLKLGQNQNFFEFEPTGYNCQVTNPPYSVKYDWLKLSYCRKKPFALLLPVETLGAKSGQRLFESYGLELILLDSRINFKMPHKGWQGGGAQFPVAWFTWGLGIGQAISYAKLAKPDKNQLSMF